jgi:DNA-binding MarR family transcriptional regulator
MTNTNPTLPQGGKPDISVCAHANLRKAMRVVSQAYDAALRPSGLRATQFTLLAVLAGRGELPLTKLSEILVMDRTTLTRNLKPLLAQGWLEIGREKDERIRLISITDDGRRIVAEATPLWQVAQNRVTEGIGDIRLSGVIDDLNALVDAVRIE